MSAFEFIVPQLQQLAIPIDSVKADPQNPQVHTDRNLAAIKESIAKKLQDQPIVVRKEDMVIIKGHGRWTAMKALGATHVAAVVVDESRLSAIERGLADNRASALSEVDDDILSTLLANVYAEGGDIIGWEANELEGIISSLELDAPEEPSDSTQEPERKKYTPESVRTSKMSGTDKVGARELGQERFQTFNTTCPHCSFRWNQ